MSAEFETLMQKIMAKTGKSREEIFELFKKKDREHSGLLPPETVLRIVAFNLGLKTSDLNKEREEAVSE
jgi:Ca2+-binding EF-hand superfamily protein